MLLDSVSVPHRFDKQADRVLHAPGGDDGGKVSVPHRFDKQADASATSTGTPSTRVSVPHRFDKQADLRPVADLQGPIWFQFLTGSISKPTRPTGPSTAHGFFVSVPHRFDKQADEFISCLSLQVLLVSVPHRFDKQADGLARATPFLVSFVSVPHRFDKQADSRKFSQRSWVA